MGATIVPATGSIRQADSGDLTVSVAPEADVSIPANEPAEFTLAVRNRGVAGTVTVTITGQNDAPVASIDSFSGQANRANVVLDVLANDTDVDAGDTLTIISATSALPDVAVTINTTATQQQTRN